MIERYDQLQNTQKEKHLHGQPTDSGFLVRI
jgi:hypothetical protein